MCGMCGNFNGKAKDDFIGKDKVRYADSVGFSQSWQHGRKSTCSVGITQQEVSACFSLFVLPAFLVWPLQF